MILSHAFGFADFLPDFLGPVRDSPRAFGFAGRRRQV